jgi:hypothetical protein
MNGSKSNTLPLIYTDNTGQNRLLKIAGIENQDFTADRRGWHGELEENTVKGGAPGNVKTNQ